VPAALLAYAVFALASGRWLSGAAAPVVAWLLWRRHARARFSAYVLLSVVVARAALTGAWWLAIAALVVIVALQTPAAARAWPRLRSDRMSRR
jgi:hypothetical protein